MSKKKPKYYVLSEEEKKQIKIMFFGPYLKQWRDKNGIVDNSDSTISKRLNIPENTCTLYISRLLDKKFIKLNNKINKK